MLKLLTSTDIISESSPRSKLLTAQTGINPLVTAAAALFTIIPKLYQLPTHTDLNKLQQTLKHEIKAFEHQARQKSCSNDAIETARFLLCTVIDEAVISSQKSFKNTWKILGIVEGNEQFFDILKQLSRDPIHTIDLLELTYLCLSLGFQGKYKGMRQGMLKREQLMEQLYSKIREQRGNFKKNLSPEHSTLHPALFTSPQGGEIKKAVCTFLAMSIAMALLYVGMNYLFTITTQPVLLQISQIQQQINHPSSGAGPPPRTQRKKGV